MGRRTKAGSLARREVRGTTVGAGRSAISDESKQEAGQKEGKSAGMREWKAKRREGWDVVGEIVRVVCTPGRHQHAKARAMLSSAPAIAKLLQPDLLVTQES